MKVSPFLNFFFVDLTCGMCYRLDLDLKSFTGTAYRTVPAYFHHWVLLCVRSILVVATAAIR